MCCLAKAKEKHAEQITALMDSEDIDVVIAENLDDLIDELWFYGDKVGFLIIEASIDDNLSELDHMLQAYPDLKVILFGFHDGTLIKHANVKRVSGLFDIRTIAADLFRCASQ